MRSRNLHSSLVCVLIMYLPSCEKKKNWPERELEQNSMNENCEHSGA